MYIKVIIRQLFGIGDASYAKGSIHDVVWFIRLPRLILAVGVGIGLSVCGTVMQAIVKIHWQTHTYWVYLQVHI